MATAGVTSSATSGAASNRDISSQLNTAVGDHLQSVKSMLKESGCWPVGVWCGVAFVFVCVCPRTCLLRTVVACGSAMVLWDHCALDLGKGG
jgi:hypothetical protein